MRDNKTSQAASLYDANVQKTIPRYTAFHEETLALVKVVKDCPDNWLDAGCGTGRLIARAGECFANLHFVATDPSEAMLDIAKEKLSALDVDFVQAGSEALSYSNQFDVITAIMSHHYLRVEMRKIATDKCFAALKQGGLYVTFETIRPFSEQGTEIGLERWRRHQLDSGKQAEEVEKHITRYGIELLPISISEHLELLRATGFAAVEILWVSGLQAGFYAIK